MNNREPHLHTLSSLFVAGGCAAVMLAMSAGSVAAPVEGEKYVYRIVNGYNNEVRGQLYYQVGKVDPNAYIVSVTPDSPWGGVDRTEIYTTDGNWWRRPLASHGQNVEYVFKSAYPAYVFPLEQSKSWSVRVNAMVPGDARTRSVRVDGTVLGRERIRVPAGEFDTFKVRRLVYAGDADARYAETKIIEFDWYAPALGRSVRTDTKSEYIDSWSCGGGRRGGGGSCLYRGEWEVFELVDAGGMGK
jgi:hypothetical protein